MILTRTLFKSAPQQKDAPMNLKSSKGFTLFEMILTVAIMAILVATTTPSIYEFIRQRDKQNEEVAQMQVRKALEAYIADKGVPPSDNDVTEPWYEKLAGYTSLSANEIANDVWGRPRMYLSYLDTSRNIYGTTVSVTYVTLHSMGENGRAERTETVNGSTVTVNGVAVSNNAFSGSTASGATGWWKNMTDRATAFATVRGAGDDQMMRYTNYEDVLRRYNATRERMDKLSEALETYARSQYANHVAACSSSTTTTATCNSDGTPRLAIYYPRSTARQVTADAARYVRDGAIVTEVVVNNAATTDDDRRKNMEDLMARLGLPLEYCCSALNNAADGKPAPFYYFSNPRPRDVSSCGARPGVDAAKLPARITTIYNVDTSAQRTCG
ncbi:MAG: prepilin-type N-terminal cleavage/methylation domain-containing protein [Blastochloris viridis]|uniref:Prepilin-type N-terminal cleavage/methylation domain-containing protein n=1 Tax=Blastochloris viridis TaxID=1079 RepID=A0A6N4RA47_BLAVI|nr:MAG: prepilin-type N-terminal cleavage/methylation domain-containing protein [Blastochloris viridis]